MQLVARCKKKIVVITDDVLLTLFWAKEKNVPFFKPRNRKLLLFGQNVFCAR